MNTVEVLVVGFVTDGGTGGFEWRPEKDRSELETFRAAWIKDGDSDVSALRKIEVPVTTRKGITAYIDANAALWEPEPGEGRKPIERLKALTGDELEGDEIMVQVFDIILSREEDDVIDVERLANFINNTPVDLYMDVIAPAIDQCEKAVREANVNG